MHGVVTTGRRTDSDLRGRLIGALCILRLPFGRSGDWCEREDVGGSASSAGRSFSVYRGRIVDSSRNEG